MTKLISLDLKGRTLRGLDLRNGGYRRTKNYDFGLSHYQNKKFSRVAHLVGLLPVEERAEALRAFTGSITQEMGNPMERWNVFINKRLTESLSVDNEIREHCKELKKDKFNDAWTIYVYPFKSLLGVKRFKELGL